MPNRFLLAVALALGSVLPLRGQSPEALKSIGARYRDTEAKLGTMGHLTWRFEDPEGATAQAREAWLDASGAAQKVTTEDADSHGLVSRVYYLDAEGLYFVLKRSESLPNVTKGTTTVHEDRLYFDGGRLIRHLTKAASFNPGQAIDTAKTKNVTHPLPTDDGGFQEMSAEIGRVVSTLRGNQTIPAPDAKPTSGGIEIVKTNPPYRLIEGTASPDGHFALAWAPEKADVIAWSKYKQDDGSYFAENEDSVVNYLVETPGGHIAATLAGKHFGDKAEYNHFSGTTLWSPNSSWMFQLLNRKWETQSAHLYRLLPGDKVAGPLDLVATASGLAYAQLRKDKNPAVAKFGTDFAITLYHTEWKNDGSLTLKLSGVIPAASKSGDPDSSFEVALELAFAVDGNAQIEARQKSIRILE